jgi:phenylalanyl-tRNA synthetase alpha subunit
VFRNETLDATHLAEFHQVEGVIADYNLTLGDLIGKFKWCSKEKFCNCNSVVNHLEYRYSLSHEEINST